MDPQHAQALRKLRIIRRDHTSVACPTQVFGGEKAEAATSPEAPNALLLPSCTDGLGGVFDYGKVMLARNLQNYIHVHRQTEQMNRHDGPSARRNRSLQPSFIEIKRIRTDIYKHRRGLQPRNRAGCRAKGERRSYYLVAS